MRTQEATTGKKPEGYPVVFEYTGEAGGYAGVRTWTSAASKEDFDKFFREQGGRIEKDGRKVVQNQLVIAEGITSKRAMELTAETPIRSYLLAALDDATDKGTGEINLERLKFKIDQIFLVIEMKGGRPQ